MQPRSFAQIEYRGRVYSIPPGGLRIGRGADNEIVILDEQSSRQHAIVWQTGGAVYIRDRNSTNGTRVNGRPVHSPVPLHPGDRIQIGRDTLIMRKGGPSVAIPRPIASMNPSPRIANPSKLLGVGPAIAAVAILILLIIGAAMLWVLTVVFSAPTPVRVAMPTSTLATSGIPVPIAPTGTVTAVSTPSQPTTVPPGDNIRRALRSVVYIESPVEGSKSYVSGSGSIVDPRGYVLTNFHVVRDVRTSKGYNSLDRIYIAVVSDPSKVPDRIFRAGVVSVDAQVDLALLKINADKDGSALPASLDLAAIAVGSSETVQIGDEIRVIGFPGVGGNTVTTSRGIISGFLENGAWIKTDTEINPGNSGGAAVNLRGELIGIPTRVVSDRTVTGKLGYIRPINLARDILAGIH